MQTERFLSILQDLRDELSQNTLVTSLNELISILPQASQQAEFETIFNSLRDFLSISKINQYPPSKVKVLNKINGSKYFGNDAFQEIESILRSPNIYNPVDKATALTSYVDEILLFKNKIDIEIASLQSFGITAFTLSENTFEVGIILLEYVTGNEIKKVQEYLEEWHLLLKYLNEITAGNHENPKVSTLGSSDSLEIYFENSKETALCIATAVDRIATIYNRVLEGKSKLQSLKDDGYIDIDIDKNYEERKDKMISDGLDNIVNEIATKYQDKNELGRINELKVGLKKSFQFIANSIDKGIDVEVNTPEPIKPEDIVETDTKEQQESKASDLEKFQRFNTEIQLIKESGSKTKLLPPNRQERILGLPEPDLKQLDSNLTSKTTKKK